jgi:polyferredoxin
MGDRFGFRLLIGIVVLAMLAAFGIYTYNLGVAHGVAESSRAVAVPGAGVPVVAFWPGPWGFGFFPFFPLLFIFFWFFVLRGLFWRGAWHRRACGYGGVPPAFDEWHRRAHAEQEQQGRRPPAPQTNA